MKVVVVRNDIGNLLACSKVFKFVYVWWDAIVVRRENFFRFSVFRYMLITHVCT